MVLIVNLYTSRRTLEVLGVDDMGIYNIVGGFVGAFTIITNTLTMATQRFITVEIGRGVMDKVRMVYSTALNVHLLFAVATWILCEIVGTWYIGNQVENIEGRMTAAHWVFQGSLLLMVVQFVCIPYSSLIIAYEHITAFAYFNIVEVLIKLGGVVYLPYFKGDLLVFYAWMLLFVGIVVLLFYMIYCARKFPEVRYERVWDKPTLKQMSNFIGWNVFGTGSGIVSNQLLTLLINKFFPLVVNTARGLEHQVGNAVLNFTRNIAMAINPQIAKSYAIGNFAYMSSLVIRGAKYCYFLFLLISLPLLFETPTVLGLWLKEVPDFTVTFVRLSLINSLVLTLTYTIDTAVYATGKIKYYQIYSGLCQMLVFPFSWLAFRWGASPWACYVVTILSSLGIVAIKMHIIRKVITVDFCFCKAVIRPCILVSLMACVAPLVAEAFFPDVDEILKFLLISILSLLTTAACVWCIGVGESERRFAKEAVCSAARKMGIK